MSSKLKQFRFVGNVPNELEGGRPVAPDEAVEVDPTDPQNKALIDAGLLQPLKAGTDPAKGSLDIAISDKDMKEDDSK